MEQVAGLGYWVFVEHIVGWLMGCSFGYWVSTKAFGWEVLGCVVMALSWFIGGIRWILLVAIVSVDCRL